MVGDTSKIFKSKKMDIGLLRLFWLLPIDLFIEYYLDPNSGFVYKISFSPRAVMKCVTF